jgi:Ca2+-binding EF-hand superfamily protein
VVPAKPARFRITMGCVHGKNILLEEDIEYIAKNTAMSREQVEIQYQSFLEKHPDGRISRKSFHEMMKECYPGADTEKLERHIFRMYDTNKDGSIDFREFMIVLYIMSNGTPEENLQQIFRVFDINNDGHITLKELQKIVRDLFLLINETNADKASQEVLVKTAFNEMDENEDGEISQKEFIEACMAQKKFSTMLTLKIIDVFISEEHQI